MNAAGNGVTYPLIVHLCPLALSGDETGGQFGVFTLQAPAQAHDQVIHTGGRGTRSRP